MSDVKGYFETETETTTEWGVAILRKDGSVFTVRWDPGYGHGPGEPYTEAEARSDASRKDPDVADKRLVTRTRTKVHTEHVTDWEDA